MVKRKLLGASEETMKRFKQFLYEEDNEKLAAGALFYAQDTGKYGLGLRSKMCDQANKYGPIGGSADTKDKDLMDTVIREVGEEIGCKITREQLKHVYTDKKPNFQYHTFLCTVPKQSMIEPKLNDENDSFDWFGKNEMPKNLHPGFSDMLIKTKDKLP